MRAGAFAGAAIDVYAAAGLLHSALHIGEPVSCGGKRRRVETLSVVADIDFQAAIFHGKLDVYFVGPCVFEGIVEGFLYHQKYISPQFAAQWYVG